MSTAARSPVIGAQKPAGSGLLLELPRLHLLVGVASALVCRCIWPWDCSRPALRVLEQPLVSVARCMGTAMHEHGRAQYCRRGAQARWVRATP